MTDGPNQCGDATISVRLTFIGNVTIFKATISLVDTSTRNVYWPVYEFRKIFLGSHCGCMMEFSIDVLK